MVNINYNDKDSHKKVSIINKTIFQTSKGFIVLGSYVFTGE